MQIGLTQTKQKTLKIKSDFSRILNAKEVKSCLVDRDIENPNVVIESLGLKTDFLEKPPFKYLRTGSEVWEFYLIRMFEIEGKTYNFWIKKFKKDEKSTYKNKCRKYERRQKVGVPYKEFKSKYPKIDDEKLKKKVALFVKRLMKFEHPLRMKDSKNTGNRLEAAIAFKEYLLKPFESQNLSKILFESNEMEALTELLKRAFYNNSMNSEHMLSVCLMLCLYGQNGRKKGTKIPHELAELVAKKIPQKKEMSDEIIHELQKVSKNFSRDFNPPYANIYNNRDRVNIFFRIRTWIKLVKDTSMVTA